MKTKINKKNIEEKKTWFKRVLDKLEESHPQAIATIKYLYGIK
jgi:hypothetical protein